MLYRQYPDHLTHKPEVPSRRHWHPDTLIPAGRDPAVVAMAPQVNEHPNTTKPGAVTPLRLYRVRAEDGNAFEIVSNHNEAILCLYVGCSFINSALGTFTTTAPNLIKWKRLEIPLADLPEELR